jgi:hypothetical protein
MATWQTAGNAGTTPPTDFLGTTDAQPLVLKTHGAEALRVQPGGNVGVGTPAPRYRLVDAEYGPIAVGDLLTTSATAGHAMPANDPARAFGATLGKALAPRAAGRGLIPVLLALQ